MQGDLTAPPLPPGPAPALAETAREHRPDRQARQVAIAEADATLRLEVANRFGNLTLGPTYEFDNSSINNIGAMISMPLPVLNTHRGVILQRQAEKARAALELRQVDVQIDQQVDSGSTRLAQGQAWADTYSKDVLPNLEKTLNEIRLLFESGDPTVGRCRFWTCSANF